MTEKPECVDNKKIIDRRSYLKATVGAAAFAGIFTKGAAASEEYDVIRLEPGEHRTYDLSEGEVWENKLIDQTARGALFRVRALNLNEFTIRNIGWLGVPTDVGGGRHVMNVATSSGGQGVVENCYISGKLASADGDTEPSTAGGMRVPPYHRGTIEFRNNFVEGLGNNASYADPPGEAGNGQGTAIYENCYHRDNTVSQFRIGSSGSTIRNSLAVVDDPSGERGRYPYSGRRTARGVWAWHTDDLWVENSTIYLSDQDSGSAENVEARVQDDSGSSPSCVVTLDGVYTNENPTWNERVNTSGGSATIRFQDVREGEPTASVLGDGGVPTSAEMAALGGREYVDPFNEGITGSPDEEQTDDSDDSESHLLAFVTDTDASGATYEFTAGGEISFTTAPYESPSGNPIEGGTWRRKDFVEQSDDDWHAGGGTGNGFGDAFTVNGPVTSIDIHDTDVMWVELDGERMTPDEVIEQTAGDNEGEEFEKLIVIDGTATPDSVSYSFSVSEALEPATYGEATINDDATVDENSVDAVVDDSVDAYWFNGNFTSFRLAGNASVDVKMNPE